MGWWLVLAILLYLACAALIIAEIYMPSGGLISIFAMACLIGGVALFFHHSNVAGVAGIGVAIVMIPSVLIIAYKVFPKTKFGKSDRGRRLR
jgi:membrane-bound serine protease (ClpP class)